MASPSSQGSSAMPKGGVEACAGCQKTNVPLHANDDPSSTQHSPSSKPRFCAQCMIGKKVKVFWPVDKSWYTGTVEKYDSSNGEHLLRYDDDDVEWVKIGELAAGPPNVSTRSSSPVLQTGNPSSEMLASDSPSYPGDSSKAETSPVPHNAAHSTMYEGTTDGRYSGRGPPTAYPPYPPSGSAAPPHQHPYHAPQGHMGGYGMSPYPHSYGSQPPPHYPPNAPPPGSYGGYPSMMQPTGGADRRPAEPLSSTSTGSHEKGSKKKAGPKVWTKEEDQMLLNMVQSMRMPMKWSVVAQQMPDRTGKQCRERYVNHLNPRLKVADWNPVEDATIFHLYNSTGSHWAKMSKMIPGRTDNGIKNRFHNLRRQLEREDEHRLRLSKAEDFPDEIHLSRMREFPQHLKGKNDGLWDIHRGIGVLAAQSVLGGGIARNAGRFGPFRTPENGDLCARCGFVVPSVQTGNELCTKTGWCLSCTRIPPHISGALLRECLNLRKCEDSGQQKVMDGWRELFATNEEGKDDGDDVKPPDKKEDGTMEGTDK
eukprot:CAMPEP_0178899134 /NCGR_PEP_ID=MMETSP0786-20121207/2722_1 /TAXON_ID=186022 /ORGANISM="Thalassionema frauenfeldii, Strain CCMP 1798" /LENGTH=537 /DNA_ID=CAMNT_0020569939 /DNA_START=125 /DNA_END=1738 /DNA_ORIENTATION=-